MRMRELGPGQALPGPVLVFVGVTWCPHCKSMKPVMSEVAQRLGSALPVVSVDGDKHAERVQRWGVQGYPTLIFLGANGRGTIYTGARTAKAVTDWACQQSGRCGLNAR